MTDQPFALLLAAALVGAAPPDPGPGARDPRSLAAAGYASVVCAAVFLQGRDPAEAGRDSTLVVVNDADRPNVDRVEVDREHHEVRASARGGPLRTARFLGDSGCVTLPEGASGLPRELPAAPPLPATSTPWPPGLLPPGVAAPREAERAAMARAIEPWFASAEALTTAVVVVHRGRIVAERYGQGATENTLHEVLSVGKSVLATLAGLAARDGLVSLEAPAPVAAWSRPGDPRAAIRLLDLLRMSSGLACTFGRREGANGYTDSQYVCTGGIDAVTYALSRPLAKPPGVEGHYANCDPLAVTAVLRDRLAERGETLTRYARRALYDRIGAGRMLTEPDPFGNPLFFAYHFAAARDLARLGVLYARDGVWAGERLLPEGFVRTVTSPAPAWAGHEYAAGFWKPAPGGPVPPDAFSMEGLGEQTVLVVPSLDLVVVRLGYPRGGDAAEAASRTALPAILEAARAAP